MKKLRFFTKHELKRRIAVSESGNSTPDSTQMHANANHIASMAKHPGISGRYDNRFKAGFVQAGSVFLQLD